MSEIVIEVRRGPLAENLLRGNAAVVGAEGKLLYRIGDPDYFTYMRSTAKPLQASAAVECGAIDHFKITEAELAVMCGSHIGDQYHIDALESILAKLGLSESDYTLGEDLSFSEELRRQRLVANVPPRKIYNNCSGKHACMLAICRYMDWEYGAYQLPEHPVQLLIRKTVAKYAELAEDKLTIGVDGCGVPVFAMPLSRMALAYHNLANPVNLPVGRALAATRITAAMAAYPQMVAGYGCFCTELMQVTKGRIIGKLGSDGVYCAAVVDGDIAIALKMEDGNMTAMPIVMMRILNDLDLLSNSEKEQFAKFSAYDNYNCQGDKVGEIRAVFELSRGDI